MTLLDDGWRCQQTTSDGRRCRMPRVNSSVSYCGTHLLAQRKRLRQEASRRPQDALDGVTDLRSATAVNHVLGNLTTLFTDGRIDYRKAVVLGYLCQLLLQTINMAKDERWNEEPCSTSDQHFDPERTRGPARAAPLAHP